MVRSARARVVVALAMTPGCYYSTTVSSRPGGDAAARTVDCGSGQEDAGEAAPDGARDAGTDAPGDGGDAAPVPVFTLDAGATWSALYRDYFGPTGVASCAGDGNCHGGTSQRGYQVSQYLCPPSGGKAGCFAGITSQGDGGANLILPDASFSDDLLSQILCQGQGVGMMPLGCTYTFTPVDMTRIGDWVAAGAQDN